MNVSAAITAVTPLIDELFTTDEERAQAKQRLVDMAYKGDLAQLEVNAQEAQHDSIFVAGWRPAVGWVCVLALALSFLVFPLIQTAAVYYGYATGEHVPTEGLPDIDWNTLGPVLLGMLGLGGLRTFEKKNGVARKRLNLRPKE